ncbi:glycoside hydrolase family 2 protein [Aestuariibacter sp. A3R04]|nr:glycoside hydrolase family 2 protein [Aestuariibacter sp. A3R04]MBU3020533.1 glycoside hydrolase family 2 protein [Aestuariibacter sp. A3R04]
MVNKASIQHTGNLLLNGAWEFRQAGTERWFPATVPGCNFTDLMAAGLIDDPFYRDNESKLQWIEKENWEYRKIFVVDEEMLSAQYIDLVADGLDTFCDISINGHPVVSTENMFVGYRIACKDVLVAGDNLIEVVFRSPICETMPRYERAGYAYPAENDKSEEKLSVYCRKAPCHFGWDWGPRFVTSGIWRDIQLCAYSHARIEDVHYQLLSLSDEKAEVQFVIALEGALPAKSSLSIWCEQSEQIATTVEATAFVDNQVCVTFTIDNPRRWWPNGLGEAFLYYVDFALICDGLEIDKWQTPVGLRTIEVINQPDDLGVSFFVKVNGHSVFMKGANYIPADSFLNRVDAERHNALMDAAVSANMNMLRVWGGGIYQDDTFYRMADEKGLLIWQDFMFACTLYPGDEGFIANVKAEAEYNIKRLRNHPCIALWCGNNEVDMAIKHWEWPEKFGYSEAVYEGLKQDYKALFDTLLPSVVAELDSNRFYMRSSPIGFWEEDADHIANHHFWGVWHGEQPFSEYQKRIPRFMSEYGFQSFPMARSLNRFTEEADRDLQSDVLRVHQKHPRGNQLIHSYMDAEFRPPKDFSQLLYLSQVQQAEGLKLAFEAHRAAMPFCMGSLYWQLNDTWPAASWSGIDYYGKWKALHYQAKRSFAEQVLVLTGDGNTVKVQAVNDALVPVQAALELSLQDFNGNVRWTYTREVILQPASSVLLHTQDLAELGDIQTDECVLVASLTENTNRLSITYFYFEPHKVLRLAKSEISLSTTIAGDELQVVLQAPVLHRHVFVDVPHTVANFSDNFFDLLAGEQKVISLPLTGMTQDEREQCQQGIVCQSLIDSFTG